MTWTLAFLYTQTAIVNNTKWFSLGEGKLPLKLAVIEIEPRPFFRTGHSGNHGGERMLEAKPLIFFEGIGTVSNGVLPALRCLDITCRCMLSFILNDFSQTEQN